MATCSSTAVCGLQVDSCLAATGLSTHHGQSSDRRPLTLRVQLLQGGLTMKTPARDGSEPEPEQLLSRRLVPHRPPFEPESRQSSFQQVRNPGGQWLVS